MLNARVCFRSLLHDSLHRYPVYACSAGTAIALGRADSSHSHTIRAHWDMLMMMNS